MNIGASVPPDVPEPSESSTTAALKTRSSTTAVSARRTFRTSPIVVVAGTEHAREKIADNAQAQCSDGRMQHSRDFLHVIEEFFQPFQSRGKSDGRNPANDAEKQIERNAVDEIVVERADVKHRLIAEQAEPDRDGQRVGQHQRNEGTRLKLKQQKLDRQQRSRNRRVEHRGQARSRAAGQQNFALRRRGRNQSGRRANRTLLRFE